MGSPTEKPLVYQCCKDTVYGILHSPHKLETEVGLVIVVGGPQYRVGSHRQFVELARGLAGQGISVFRFDCRGMGDSEGNFPGFENLDVDIRMAIDEFMRSQPQITKVVVWGLCDGATAAGLYAPKDDRIIGLCLVNPWVRTEQGEAEAFIKHYYIARLCSKAFWGKLISGRFRVWKSLSGLLKNIQRSNSSSNVQKNSKIAGPNQKAEPLQQSLPARMFGSLTSYRGGMFFIISGNDLTAAEFMDATKEGRSCRKLIKSSRVSMLRLSDADHTFSRRVWMIEVIDKTAQWVKSI